MFSVFKNDCKFLKKIFPSGNPIWFGKIFLLGFFSFAHLFGSSVPIFSQNGTDQKSREQAESKPLLRVFPSFRKEECDWAIRWDICLNCLKIGRRYAQKIHFYPSGPYREHGCYSEEEGFFLLED